MSVTAMLEMDDNITTPTPEEILIPTHYSSTEDRDIHVSSRGYDELFSRLMDDIVRDKAHGMYEYLPPTSPFFVTFYADTYNREIVDRLVTIVQIFTMGEIQQARLVPETTMCVAVSRGDHITLYFPLLVSTSNHNVCLRDILVKNMVLSEREVSWAKYYVPHEQGTPVPMFSPAEGSEIIACYAPMGESGVSREMNGRSSSTEYPTTYT